MKRTILSLMLFVATTAVAQQVEEVKFRDESFPNGMVYPQTVISKNPKAQEAINVHIKEQLKEIEASDYCIGQHGFVQKGIHLQIHVFANCIDFDESRNMYFFYNLESGQAVPYSDLLGAKRKEAGGKFLLEKTLEFLGPNADKLTEEQKTAIKEKNLDAFDVQLVRSGISIKLSDFEGWGNKRLELTWGLLRSYLRVNYI